MSAELHFVFRLRGDDRDEKSTICMSNWIPAYAGKTGAGAAMIGLRVPLRARKGVTPAQAGVQERHT